MVQEAFVKAFRSLPKFRAGGPFAPWLLSIVANETKNLLRSRHRRNALALRLSALEPDAAAPDAPFDEAVAGERRARLLAAVNELPERERQALVCRYFLDLSEAETAQVRHGPGLADRHDRVRRRDRDRWHRLVATPTLRGHPAHWYSVPW